MLCAAASILPRYAQIHIAQSVGVVVQRQRVAAKSQGARVISRWWLACTAFTAVLSLCDASH